MNEVTQIYEIAQWVKGYGFDIGFCLNSYK